MRIPCPSPSGAADCTDCRQLPLRPIRTRALRVCSVPVLTCKRTPIGARIPGTSVARGSTAAGSASTSPYPRLASPRPSSSARADPSPRPIVAILLEEKKCLCSARSMHRLLAEHDELRERRHARRHPKYQRPELMATRPRQTWSWDVTFLRGPTKGSKYPLYVIIDIYSHLAGYARKTRSRGASSMPTAHTPPPHTLLKLAPKDICIFCACYPI